MKPTRGELRAHVELLAKKRRSVKRKAQDPPKSSLPARGKVPKLGVSYPRSRAQVQVRGQSLSSSAEVSEVVGAQRRSSSAIGVKGSSRKAIEPPLKVLLSLFGALRRKRCRLPLRHGETWEMIALKLRGVRTRYSPMRSSLPRLFRLSFRTLISRKWKPYALRRLWPCPSKGPSLYV